MHSSYCSHPMIFYTTTSPKFPAVFDMIEQWTLWCFRDLLGHLPRQGRPPLSQFCMAWFFVLGRATEVLFSPLLTFFFWDHVSVTWKYSCTLPKKHAITPFFLWYRKGNTLTLHKVTGSEQCFPSDYKSQFLLLPRLINGQLRINFFW